jgi:hypothetical protein
VTVVAVAAAVLVGCWWVMVVLAVLGRPVAR